MENEQSSRVRERNRTLDWEGIDSERQQTLKQARSAKKGLITKAQNEIRDLMLDFANVDVVKGKVEELKQILDSFNEVHSDYHSQLTEERDIVDSDEYSRAVNQAVTDLANDIANWVVSEEFALPQLPPPPRVQSPKPEDFVSSISTKVSGRSKLSLASSKASRSSSASAAKAKAAARRAALKAEAANLESFQAIQREEFSLQLKRKALELHTEIAKAEAEELVYAEAEAGYVGDPVASLIGSRKPVVSQMVNTKEKVEPKHEDALPPEDLNQVIKSEVLNPDAKSWVPGDAARLERKPLNSPLELPDSNKESDARASSSERTMTGDFAHRLLEEQCKQNQRMQELIKQQQESTFALTLPEPEVPTFSGNPIDYWSFVRAFENLIERKTTSESARLYYLVQYTTGEVKELVKSCLAMNEEIGYREARSLLKARYGQSYRIATAYVDKLTKGPAIKTEDGEALRRFSIVLTGCKNTLKEIGYLNKVENPETLKTIVNRLPYGLRQKWRDVADNITETVGREITIEDLSNFVTAKARAATHAVFGDISSQPATPPRNSREKRPPRNASSFGIQADSRQERGTRNQPTSTRLKCPLCGSNHWLSHFNGFKTKSLSDRLTFVRLKGLCVNCLVGGHMATSCPKASFCRVTGCRGVHSSYLHPKAVRPTTNEGTETSASSDSDSPLSTQASAQEVLNSYIKGKCDFPSTGNRDQSCVTGLAVIPVRVKAPGSEKTVVTYAFLDNGSNTSFCSEELAIQLGLPGRQTTLSLTTMEKENSRAESLVVSLEVLDLEEENIVELPVVFTRPKLPVSVETAAKQEDVDRWPHLADIVINRIEANVGLLIGSDVPEAMEPREIRPSRNGGPYATRTVFGWVVNGPLGRAQSSANRTANFIKADIELNDQFRNYCNMEFNDSVYSSKSSMSPNDKRAMDIMRDTAKLKNGHYEVALPWKDDPPFLENNKIVAEHRLKLLKKRLLKDPELMTKYKDCIEDLLQKGYAKKAPATEFEGKTWYLPHHAVFHPAKPGKVRVVFDCSAKYRRSSLNDKLLQGPDFTNSLVGVLTRFRQEKIALMSDVEAMFHQVRVKPDDCNALRFLWWPGGDLSLEPEELMMTVHLFGGVSSPSCANFALRKTADDNEADFKPDIVTTVKRNFYVDDCLKSVESEQVAIGHVKDLTSLLKKGGFQLTKWLSNSREVVESIPESERATSVKDLDFDHAPMERALGVQWHVVSDTFSFKITIKDRPATRRGILSVVSSVYDPLGFVAPFILPAKLILQDLCKKKLDWDDKIPDEDLERWKTWLEALLKLEEFSTERCFKPPEFGEVVSCQLHYFSDASQLAYGSVSYLRLVDSCGNIHCSFVMGKSRLAPLKPVTIPRMELSAAVLSTRLDRMIREELEYAIDESFYWTDSTCVLRYVENEDKRYQTFVANRVSAIREQSTPAQWKYVETKLNPADDASRGMTVHAILESNHWSMGPCFLWQNEENWPKRPAAMDVHEEEEPHASEENATTFLTLFHPASQNINKVFERFSSWLQLKKCVAWILRFKDRLRSAVTKRKQEEFLQPCSEKKVSPLDVKEMEVAEKAIMKAVQGLSFSEELLSLKTSQKQVKKSSSLVKLDPILVEGIICVGGRLHNSPIKQEAKHPVILPKDHHVSELIMRYYHLISGHSGLEHTLSLIRQKYWIIQVRVPLRRILSSCFDCRRRQASVD